MNNSNSNNIKVCIVDDHELIRLGMSCLLEKIKNVKLIFEASNGLELIEKIETNLPDVIFMDINMPVLNGIEATTIIKKKYPHIKIIVLTAYKDPISFKKMINLGIQGFINKSASINEIRTALSHINNGLKYISNDLFDLISESIVKKECISSIFSKREIEILDMIYTGYDTKEIAKKIFLSQRTIEKHKYNMMIKTETSNTVQLIVYAIKNGIIKTEKSIDLI